MYKIFFTALELSGIYLGIKYDEDLKSNSTSPYYNYPLFIGLQAFGIEKLNNFRNQMELLKYHRPDFKYHDISEKDLYLAPFKKENVFTPITGGMVLLAGVFLGIEKYNEQNGFSNVLFADEPDYGAALLQVGEATIAGYFLGRDVQKRNYKIGPAIAAHMWYDAVLMIGSFLINPKDNFLGVNIKFGIN